MIFIGVDLSRRVVKLGGLGALVANGAGFLVFKWALHTVIFGVDLKHFALFGRVPRPCNMHIFFAPASASLGWLTSFFL